ncbi:MAG: NAD(P)-dependent alcohol dehydrogenase [Caldilineae bacterium]|nr:NAD(P)-dependent alcohol dehydrogenase [Anaerolineae bacterium]MCB0253619.1 NAD(P)-dependent alcohol dehydrogenase [Anaerolineae bacterium]MCB9152463.1 NAD(P)-dependent alcohol dehydrogenase [Caldilineae bacterium]
MKAIVQNSYGSPDVLELKEIARPSIDENDVIVRVHAAAVNAGDVFSMRGSPWLARFSVGFPSPKDHVLGWDMAGRVEAVGEAVTRFQAGDEVFAVCEGAFAEYVSVGEEKLALKPANLTFVQAAAIPSGGITALQGLRDIGNLQPGQKVLINGASGGVGTMAVQIAKAMGAEVTGVCSTRNVEMVRSIGADHVIDYTQEDFTQGGERYDLILDNVASRSFTDLRRVLAPQGVVVPNSGHGGMGYVFKAYLLSPIMRQQKTPFLSSPNSEDLTFLKELIEAGKLTPVIDRIYRLSETPAAFRYLEEEHAQGKVIITVAENGK